MSEQDLNDAMGRLSESARRAVQRERRRSIQSPSDVLALLRADRAREAAFKAWLDVAGPAVAAELTEELIPADMHAAGMRFEWGGAGMSGWDAVDDALMYGVGNPPDPWCADDGCVHAGMRHKHTRLFRKPCVMAEDGTILEAER